MRDERAGSDTMRAGGGGSRRWLWFWLAVAGASLALLIPKWAADVRWARQLDQWNRTGGVRSAMGQQSMRAVLNGLRAMQRQAGPGTAGGFRRVTRAEVEAKFGGSGTITWTAPAPEIAFAYVDNASGWRGDFRLHNGGSGASWGSASPPARPTWPAGLNRVRQLVTSGLITAWWVLLGAACWPGRGRAAVRHLLLAAAVLATVGLLLAPNYAVTLRGMMVNDAAGFGAGMTAVSAGVFAVAAYRAAKRRRLAEGPPRCGHCGYDLSFNESGVCPECGRPHAIGTAEVVPAPAAGGTR